MTLNFLKLRMGRYGVLPVIFGLGLLLRLIGSVRVGMTFDERIWIEIADKVSFSADNFNLVLHGAYHPFFEAYLIKLSMLIFDNNLLLYFLPSFEASRLSIRFMHVILSSATIIVIYFLVKEGAGKTAAVFASLIIALCQFHIHFSRTVMQTASLLFFVSLSLLLFWKAVNQDRDKFIIFTGISIGFGYLSEETASLLFIVFLVFLIMTGRFFKWLKKWETYAGVVVFLLIISPDLYWNITTPNPDMKYHLERAAGFQGISLLPAMLFTGELFLMLVRDLESFVGGVGHRMLWSLEYPTMHWVPGILCLIAIIYSLKKRNNDFTKLMQLTFFCVFLFFTFFASSGPFGNFNFWWASICFIPAIVLLSDMLSDIYHRNLYTKYLPAALVVYLFYHSVMFLSIDENIYVRRPSFLSKVYIYNASYCLLSGQIPCARDNFRKALKNEPASAAALINLIDCNEKEGKYQRAESIRTEARLKGITLSAAGRFLVDRGYIKEWLIDGYYKVSDSSRDHDANLSMINSLSSADKRGIPDAGKYEKLVSPTAFINLKKLLNNPSNSLSYAYTRIYSPEDKQVRLLIGFDDGVAIWLNREKVYENSGKGFWYPDEETVNVLLKQGWNDLVLKVLYNEGLLYGFSIRLADSTGEIIDNLQSEAFPR